ncbi:aldo/keto reductase [Corynebacterium pacaense]|uniref:aldo/keto reductase n=1 Tax=Corynebacterium pacaense TaxID=1816684 RepID=UPI001FE88732|nr:aldo/keto reductase [Corynebacterium pacaense]
MKQRRVGASGLRVSRLGLGTSTWGAGTDLREAGAILGEFIGAGGTLIDASPAYADGRAEQILAELLSNTHTRRDVVISSSAGVDPTRPMGQRVDCSRSFLLSQLDATLSALGTDHLDLWSVGFWDDRTPLHEIADTLDYAVRTGRVRYAGVRGFAGWQLALLHAATSTRPIVAAQAEYSLLLRRAEEELLPAAQHLGVGFFAGAPLGRGVLTAKYRSEIPAGSRAASTFGDVEVRGYLDPRSHTIVDALDTAAVGLGISATAAAMTWVRDRPGVSSVIVGARTPEQLSELLRAERVALPAQITSALDDVSL